MLTSQKGNHRFYELSLLTTIYKLIKVDGPRGVLLLGLIQILKSNGHTTRGRTTDLSPNYFFPLFIHAFLRIKCGCIPNAAEASSLHPFLALIY